MDPPWPQVKAAEAELIVDDGTTGCESQAHGVASGVQNFRWLAWPFGVTGGSSHASTALGP